MPAHTTRELIISNLAERHRLSRSLLNSYLEAFTVVLESLSKLSPVEVTMIMDEQEVQFVLAWEKPGDSILRSFANAKDATEYGAYALAFASLDALENYEVVHRAHQGSGADFLLLKRGDDNDENVIRLEVSGILNQGNVRNRLQVKVTQLQNGNLKRPGIALVAAFNQQNIQARRVP